MQKKHYFCKKITIMQSKLTYYVWAAQLIASAPKGITFAEISRKWSNTSFGNGNPLPRRTFTDWLNNIQDIFNINIECDRHTNRYYMSTSKKDFDNICLWLINSMQVTEFVQSSKSLRERIIFESIPSGNELIETIMEAMKTHHTLQMSYLGFGYDQPYIKEVCPYCLKAFKKRWYLVTSTLPANNLRVFALDRMQELIPTENTFRLPRRFSAEKYFANSYGIYSSEGKHAATIRIRANRRERDYLRTLPLHDSQCEVLTELEYSEFTFRLHPTFDFIQELLSHGDQIEVLQPQSLRDQISDTVESMYHTYCNTQRKS